MWTLILERVDLINREKKCKSIYSLHLNIKHIRHHRKCQKSDFLSWSYKYIKCVYIKCKLPFLEIKLTMTFYHYIFTNDSIYTSHCLVNNKFWNVFAFLSIFGFKFGSLTLWFVQKKTLDRKCNLFLFKRTSTFLSAATSI